MTRKAMEVKPSDCMQAQNNIMRAAVAAQQGKQGSSKAKSGQQDALRRLQVARMHLQGQPT